MEAWLTIGRIQLRHRLPRLPKRKLSLRKRKQKQQVWVYNGSNLEQEHIFPEKFMRLIYENPVGSASLLWLVKRKAISRVYGLYCRTRHSAKMIPKFIEQYDIDMTGSSGRYKNFAQFFARERDGISFPESAQTLGSPCEGLVSVFEGLHPDQIVAAKGAAFSLTDLFRDANLAKGYEGGTMVSIRLTPANYHRMHFFDNGTVTASRIIKGDLYSVSPLALNKVIRLYCRNKRAIIEFETENFGNVVLVEVGATFVGSIVHCFEADQKVERSQMASYFKPGGSLVLMFLKKGAFTPRTELVERTAQGYETKVSIGEALSTTPNA